MARPKVIQDETIIAAAREVFLARGIRATTAEVAERAGISEGSIFKRFKSKAELFQAAMGANLEEPDFWRLLDRAGAGELAENLHEMALEMIVYFRTIMPLMMMAWSNPGAEGVPCMMSQPDPPPLRTLKKLTAYFEAEMRLGRIRRHDPELVARAFLGSVQNFVTFEVLFRSQEELPLGAESFVRGLVQLLFKGLEPAPPS